MKEDREEKGKGGKGRGVEEKKKRRRGERGEEKARSDKRSREAKRKDKKEKVKLEYKRELSAEFLTILINDICLFTSIFIFLLYLIYLNFNSARMEIGKMSLKDAVRNTVFKKLPGTFLFFSTFILSTLILYF